MSITITKNLKEISMKDLIYHVSLVVSDYMSRVLRTLPITTHEHGQKISDVNTAITELKDRIELLHSGRDTLYEDIEELHVVIFGDS